MNPMPKGVCSHLWFEEATISTNLKETLQVALVTLAAQYYIIYRESFPV